MRLVRLFPADNRSQQLCQEKLTKYQAGVIRKDSWQKLSP